MFKVIKQEGSYTSKLVASPKIKKGATIGSFKETATKTAKVRYSSVQVGRNEHLELNSDFVYLNHSCDPNTRLDVKNMEVVAEKDIAEGDELNFFYPSTEWEMAQPFQCWCGSTKCLKEVKGAKFMSKGDLKKHGFINDHILLMVDERDTVKQ